MGDVDPILNVEWYQEEEVEKLYYHIEKDTFSTARIKIQLAKRPFAAGAMRSAFIFKDISKIDGKNLWVAKFSKKKSHNKLAMYENDIRVQAHSERIAEAYNKHKSTPKKVKFLRAYLIRFFTRKGTPVAAVEKYIKGEYVKYSNNYGFVLKKNSKARNTPQAFSHFSFEYTEKKMIVVDIQGVNDVYTDPQIHSLEKTSKFGIGNLGKKGIDAFFRTHKCNAICAALGLPNYKKVERSTPMGLTHSQIYESSREQEMLKKEWLKLQLAKEKYKRLEQQKTQIISQSNDIFVHTHQPSRQITNQRMFSSEPLFAQSNPNQDYIGISKMQKMRHFQPIHPDFVGTFNSGGHKRRPAKNANISGISLISGADKRGNAGNSLEDEDYISFVRGTPAVGNAGTGLKKGTSDVGTTGYHQKRPPHKSPLKPGVVFSTPIPPADQPTYELFRSNKSFESLNRRRVGLSRSENNAYEPTHFVLLLQRYDTHEVVLIKFRLDYPNRSCKDFCLKIFEQMGVEELQGTLMTQEGKVIAPIKTAPISWYGIEKKQQLSWFPQCNIRI